MSSRPLWVASIVLALTTPVGAYSQTPAKPRVHILATGGTISNTGTDTRRTGRELVDAIPRLAEIAQVTTEQFSNVASGAITLEQWRQLALRVRDLAREEHPPAGIVITHGTDTMEETAFFLDLTVGGCTPVVLTGAMRQATATGADGPANLLNAVRVAAAPVSRGRGVLLFMNDEIFRARDVTKSNTSRMNAFTAPDGGPIGVTDPDTVAYDRAARTDCPAPRFDVSALGDLPRVDVVYSYVAADSVIVDALLAAGARGLVVASVGRGGNTPAQGRALRRATERGVIVATSNRTGSGRVSGASTESLDTLPAGRGAFIGAEELNPQKARVLLMLGLAATMRPGEIATLFRQWRRD
jgi:L-asparaginase